MLKDKDRDMPILRMRGENMFKTLL